MANGHGDLNPEELHRAGCEYGRSLAKDVGYMRNDVAELKKGIENLGKEFKSEVGELRKSNGRIEQQLARSEWIKVIATAALSVVTAALVSGALNR